MGCRGAFRESLSGGVTIKERLAVGDGDANEEKSFLG